MKQTTCNISLDSIISMTQQVSKCGQGVQGDASDQFGKKGIMIQNGTGSDLKITINEWEDYDNVRDLIEGLSKIATGKYSDIGYRFIKGIYTGLEIDAVIEKFTLKSDAAYNIRILLLNYNEKINHINDIKKIRGLELELEEKISRIWY